MGPERGVKAEGKVRLWEIQVEPYMSKRETALNLYSDLSGEPEQELENAATGVPKVPILVGL